nr:hypothetical protein [Nocardia seriolae]
MVNVTGGFGSSILGYPRVGEHRQLKRALESYWHGALSRDELLAVGARSRRASSWSWRLPG